MLQGYQIENVESVMTDDCEGKGKGEGQGKIKIKIKGRSSSTIFCLAGLQSFESFQRFPVLNLVPKIVDERRNWAYST